MKSMSIVTRDGKTKTYLTGGGQMNVQIQHKGTTYDIREIRGKLEFRELD